MRKRLFILFIISSLFISLAALAHSGKNRGSSISLNDDDGGPVDCSDVEVTFDGQKAARAQDQVTISGKSPLKVRVGSRGGIHVRGGSGSDYLVRLCKAATMSESNLLSKIQLENRGGELSVSGPSGDAWFGYLLIDAPKSASLDLEATNGPIGIDEVAGNVKAFAQNGPISVKNSSGRIEAKTQNGPISFAGSEGDHELSAVNGPLSIKLDGSEWRGKGLVASTQNGPVSLAIDEDYRSGVQLESRGNGPWSYKGSGKAGRRDWDDDSRTMEFGSGPTVVKISTVNGPVSVKRR